MELPQLSKAVRGQSKTLQAQWVVHRNWALRLARFSGPGNKETVPFSTSPCRRSTSAAQASLISASASRVAINRSTSLGIINRMICLGAVLLYLQALTVRLRLLTCILMLALVATGDLTLSMRTRAVTFMPANDSFNQYPAINCRSTFLSIRSSFVFATGLNSQLRT